MTTRKILSLFVVLAAALLLSSCSKKKKPVVPPVVPVEEASGHVLNGTNWLLESLRDQAVQPGSTLNFDKDQARGSAGCNSYSGPYMEGVKGKFHLEFAVMTKKQCSPPEVMQQEQRFVEMMKTATAFQIDAGKLTLQDTKGSAVAVFKAQSQNLRGTQWQVLRYSNGQGGMADLLTTNQPLTAWFQSSGQLSGHAGCNNYLANYTFSPKAKTFSFEMIMMMTKQCASDAIMEQEGSFMAALYSAVAYRIEEDVLTLNDAEGNPAVVLMRK
ncbi:META domain-containing protein [Candidatus Electronema sp. PJ]|uniref:META domain-containing protein n=1 Tax=Candidatus Electronema sp. PJ TaxID=3401572 RepID=UPI003AA91335